MPHDVRQLLLRARDSFHSIHLELDAEYDSSLLQHVSGAAEAAALAAESPSVALIAPPMSAMRAGADGTRTRHVWRAWWHRPSRWRDDIVWPNGSTAVSIVNGGSSTMYVSAQQLVYKRRHPASVLARLRGALGFGAERARHGVDERLRQMPLVDPSFLLEGWELTALGESRHLDRDTVRVRATRIAPHARISLWQSVEQYDVQVDRERGVLLRLAPIVGGAEAAAMSATLAHFDEPIPAEVFSFQPPSGTRILML